MNNSVLTIIRESEKQSHIATYTNEKLYQSDSWLKKPIKTVQEIMPLFADYERIHALDLGCGVGRNSLFVAESCRGKECAIDCVDFLEIAIEKLLENAKEHKVEMSIRGIAKAIEDFVIPKENYDFILAVSALEHVESEEIFARKLVEIAEGTAENGVVCLVLNSEVREENKDTGEMLVPQFEVNLPTKKMVTYVEEAFRGWKILKRNVSEQEYENPRENVTSRLTTRVVSYVVRKSAF